MRITWILGIVCVFVTLGIFLFPFLKHDWLGTIKGLAWLFGILLFAFAAISLFTA